MTVAATIHFLLGAVLLLGLGMTYAGFVSERRRLLSHYPASKRHLRAHHPTS